MTPRQELRAAIAEKTARIGIIGLGYTGLPLGLTFAEAGFSVVGFDVDPEKVSMLSRGSTYIRHLDASRIAKVLDSQFTVTTDFQQLANVDVVIICVPTPLTPQRQPDMQYVVGTTQTVLQTLRAGQLIILESTTYPGTTDELLRAMLQRSGFACGRDFFLAYSPEREDPGNADYATASIPKVIGGVDEASTELAELLYAQVIERTVRVSSARTAEASKLTENIFRAVNIALVNELKMVYDRMGIDIWEVLDAAETKPFGFMRFDPGPGLGGHCIPLDPFYLSWKAKEYGLSTRFIELAGEVNVHMPHFVVEKLQGALNQSGKALKEARVLLLGLAYKKDVDDPRESPAFDIIDRLLRAGAEVNYHDPLVPTAPAMRRWPDLPAMQSIALSEDALASQDAVVIVTDHRSVDYEFVLRHAPLVIDSRGVFRVPHNKVVKA